MYQHNGVYFEFPESWEIIDDDGDDIVRAISVECPNEGYYSMDIYNSEQAPSLENYIEHSLKYFNKELPFGFKIINESTKHIEKAIYHASEIEGLQLEFTVRTLFRKKINYICRYFRVNSGRKVSLISGQYLAVHAIESKAGLNEILASYRLV